jgi:para-nitrobenzyl esterase
VRKSLIVGFFIAATFAITPFALSQIQNVKSTGSQLQGVVADGVASFKGIPFAAPPVGDLRWKAPQSAKGWAGIKKADAYAPGCMQDPGMSKMIGSAANIGEDCLYLNVWTAAKTAA